jgi:uncharacterized membrane protein
MFSYITITNTYNTELTILNIMYCFKYILQITHYAARYNTPPKGSHVRTAFLYNNYKHVQYRVNYIEYYVLV